MENLNLWKAEYNNGAAYASLKIAGKRKWHGITDPHALSAIKYLEEYCTKNNLQGIYLTARKK